MTQVVSSLSGIQLYAPTAGYAPTNSGDVSAIASAYQVVSSTGTQLYAGTAHVTSVNGDPLSASRAGNAANASLATSAWYDGTGRLISSLPDGAEVSSIASSYAGSAASSKLDTSAFSSVSGTFLTSVDLTPYQEKTGMSAYALSGDVSSVIDTVSSNSASWGQGGVDSATVSSIASSYAKSAASACVPISSISGYSGDWNSVYNTVNTNSASWTGSTGGSVSSPYGTIFVTGSEIEGTNSAVMTADNGESASAIMYYNQQSIGTYLQSLTNQRITASGATLYFVLRQTAYHDFGVVLSGYGLDGYATSASGSIPYGTLTAAIPMEGVVSGISASASEWIDLDLYNNAMSAIKEGGAIVTGVGELAWASSVSGVVNTVSSNSASWGQGGVDSATVSAIASSYVESGVSGKLDSSASSSFYTTANESGFITGVDLSPYQTTAGMSGYIPTSMSSDFQQASGMSSYALSSDVSGTVDLVSTQSANWGGSALQMSAGPGVKLEKSGNVLIASTDETVLWSGEGSSGNFELSEDPYNFETLRIYGSWQPPELSTHDVMIGKTSGMSNKFMIAGFAGDSDTNNYMYARDTWYKVNNSGYNISAYRASETVFVGTNIDRQSTSQWAYRRVYKIVGINRTAEA